MGNRLKPALFLAFGNPEEAAHPGGNALDPLPGLREEEKKIGDALHDVCELGSWDYLSGLNCTRAALVDHFKSDRIAIFHFGGHASPQSLFLPAETPGNQVVSGTILDEFLARQTSLKLAFFNACSTQEWAAKLAERIPYVIATVCPVPDEMAPRFASAFYSALTADKTIDDAFALAKAAVTLEKETLHQAVTVDAPQFRRMEIGDDASSQTFPPTFPWILCKNGRVTSDDARWTFSVAARDPLIGLPLLDESSYQLPDCPYVSIKGHTEADAPLFFGRGAEIRQLYDWALSDTNAAPILLFHGQSGSGKSSLLDAGLRPRLKQNCTVEYRRRGAHLIDDLHAVIGGSSDEKITAWLNADSPKLIILDQVEEAITHNGGSTDEIHAFVQRVKETFSHRPPQSNARLLLSFRKEYLAEIQGSFAKDTPADAPSLIDTFWLDRLDHDGIVQVVEGPTLKRRLRDKYNIVLEDGFAEFVASRLTDPASPIATILQILLNQLWEKANQNAAQNGGRIVYTQALWSELSALDNPLHGFYGDQLESLFAEAGEQYRRGLELDLLLEHTTDLGTSQRRTFAELTSKYPQIPEPELRDLIRRNKDRYLLTDPPAVEAEDSSGGTPAGATVLAHDTLAPVIRRDHALSVEPGAKARRLVENRSREWVDGKTGGPLDTFDLRTVNKGRSQMRALNGDEQRMLVYSRKRARRILATIVCVVLALLSIPSTIGYLNWQTQTALRLAGEARAETPSHYDLAILLSIAAYKIDHAPLEVRDAITSVYEARPEAIGFLHPLHPHSFFTSGIAFSNDGRQLAIINGDEAELWNVRQRTRIWSVSVRISENDPNGTPLVAISPDGQWLALANTLGIQVRSMRTGALVRQELDTPPQLIGSIAFSDSHLFAAGCSLVQEWDIKQWAPMNNLPAEDPGCGSEDQLTNIAVNPRNPAEIATRYFHGEVFIGKTVVRSPEETEHVHDSGVYLLAYSADGSRLVASTRFGDLEVFDIPHHISLGKLPRPSDADWLGTRLNYDGSRLSALMHGALGQFDLQQTAQPLRPVLEAKWNPLNFATISPDFTTVAMRGLDGDVLLLDNNWGLGFVLPLNDNPDQVEETGAVAFSPDGKWIASATMGGSVFLWNSATHQLVSRFAPSDQLLMVDSVAFSPDSQILAWPIAGSVRNPQLGVHRVEVPGGRQLPDILIPGDKNEITLGHIAFAPDGSLVANSDQGVLRIWKSGAGGPPRILRAQTFPGSIAISPDGKFLAAPSANGQILKILDFETGQPAQPEINAQGMPAESIDFSPASPGSNPQPLVAEGHPYGISVWNYRTGKQLGRADTGETPITGVKFSPDGRLLAVGLQGGGLRLWDVAAANWLGDNLTRNGDSATTFGPRVKFSPDGKRIIWGGPRGAVFQWDWDLQPDTWVSKGCSIAARNLTRQEWAAHLPLRPYRKLCANLPIPPDASPAPKITRR